MTVDLSPTNVFFDHKQSWQGFYFTSPLVLGVYNFYYIFIFWNESAKI
jgi:hypothetical protein